MSIEDNNDAFTAEVYNDAIRIQFPIEVFPADLAESARHLSDAGIIAAGVAAVDAEQEAHEALLNLPGLVPTLTKILRARTATIFLAELMADRVVGQGKDVDDDE